MRLKRAARVFRCVLESLYEGLSVRPYVGPSIRPSRLIKNRRKWLRYELQMNLHDDVTSLQHSVVLKRVTDLLPYLRTDTPSYRDARTHLKRKKKLKDIYSTKQPNEQSTA